MNKRILTVTMNPSVDIGYRLDPFTLDAVNRAEMVTKTAGGKGLNVSRVLRQLGEKVTATGLAGGPLGDFIRSQIRENGIEDAFVPIKGETRNCIAILHGGQQTEILESGPEISGEEMDRFLKVFAALAEKADIITISGSLPKGADLHLYRHLLGEAEKHEAAVLLDINGGLLAETLHSPHKPYMIKPNLDELGELLGGSMKDENSIVQALEDSNLFADIPLIVVTMGKEGALIKRGMNYQKVTASKVEVKNPVGSGDSVIAGFAAGLSRGLDDEQLIKFGLTMGVLNAMEEKTGHINPGKIDWCMDEIKIEAIEPF